MKKQTIIMVCLVSLLLPSYTMAQDGERVWSFGPEIGVNFSKYGKDASDSDFRSGILLGLGLTYSIENLYGFTAKVLYSQKGAEFGDTKQSLKYVEVPVVGRFFFNREGTFRPNLFIGPSFGFLTGVSVKDGDNDSVELDNYSDVYNTFDLGVAGGLGFNWLIGDETRIIIDGRYTHGLSDITKGEGSVNNQAISVSAGLTFGIGN
jgi:outer membrane protein W